MLGKIESLSVLFCSVALFVVLSGCGDDAGTMPSESADDVGVLPDMGADAAADVSDTDAEGAGSCPAAEEVLSAFVLDGQSVIISTSGEAFFEDGGECEFVATYFEPGFEEAYVTRDGNVFLVTAQGEAAVRLEHEDDFSNYTDFIDLFPTSIADVDDHFFTAFTLQSPQVPTVEDYVELRACMLARSCEPPENRIDLTDGPGAPGNPALRFEAVAPGELVTSKASVQSTLPYYVDGDEVWVQSRFFIESGMPYSLIDIETEFFLESPGPRVVVSGGRLAFENKFGEKRKWSSQDAPLIPLNTWFSVTVRVVFDYEEGGHFELYQDGALVLEGDGVTLPTSNAIQNSVEIGITATSEPTVMFIDDFVLSTTRPE